MNTNDLNNIPKISDLSLLDIDTDAEWKKFAASAGITYNEPKVIRFSGFMKIAASLVVALGLALTVYMVNRKINTDIFMSENQTVEACVENYTKISLNRHSYAECYSSKGVFNVDLKGQAYFDVEKNPAREFRVTTPEVTVIVHGTSFDVCGKAGKTVVTVTSGNVEVKSNSTGKSVCNLTKGARIECFEDGRYEVSQVDNFNSIAWKLKKFEFENCFMKDVVKQLGEAYGFCYSFEDPEIEKMTITGVFENQCLKSVFNVLQQTLDIKIEQDSKGSFKIKK